MKAPPTQMCPWRIVACGLLRRGGRETRDAGIVEVSRRGWWKAMLSISGGVEMISLRERLEIKHEGGTPGDFSAGEPQGMDAV